VSVEHGKRSPASTAAMSARVVVSDFIFAAMTQTEMVISVVQKTERRNAVSTQSL
jgi:hypothetical protein